MMVPSGIDSLVYCAIKKKNVLPKILAVLSQSSLQSCYVSLKLNDLIALKLNQMRVRKVLRIQQSTQRSGQIKSFNSSVARVVYG